jgi:hypothetical protein
MNWHNLYYTVDSKFTLVSPVKNKYVNNQKKMVFKGFIFKSTMDMSELTILETKWRYKQVFRYNFSRSELQYVIYPS